jgi:predicted metalloprotease
MEGERESSNIEDRRGISGGTIAAGGGGLAIIIAIIVALMGGDPRQVLNNAPPGGGTAQLSPEQKAAQDEQAKFVSRVLASTEDVWKQEFQKMGKSYPTPKLVLFTGSVKSACGHATAASGPFYCPGDSQIYIDLSFYNELKTRFRAPGDFAQAYVIAHEVGHHVQHLLGITDKVDAQRSQVSKTEYNKLSVRLELQADFLAGYWAARANEMRGILESGDVEEGLNAASAIGDDRLQKQSQGYVVPDAFTHGTSAQRVKWFRKGMTARSLAEGDTFNIPDP